MQGMAVACMQILCRIPQEMAITEVDAVSHALVGPLTEGRDTITQLALWLLGERQAARSSPHKVFVNALPVRSSTTLLPMCGSIQRLTPCSHIVDVERLGPDLAERWLCEISSSCKAQPCLVDGLKSTKWPL
jgi:protein-histidine N-methyltransferase